MKEISEAKSLRWLANMFPMTKNPKDGIARMTNCINLYCTAGADKIEELQTKVEELENEINRLKDIIN